MDSERETDLASLYEGQLDAVLSAWNEAMMRHLGYGNIFEMAETMRSGQW